MGSTAANMTMSGGRGMCDDDDEMDNNIMFNALKNHNDEASQNINQREVSGANGPHPKTQDELWGMSSDWMIDFKNKHYAHPGLCFSEHSTGTSYTFMMECHRYTTNNTTEFTHTQSNSHLVPILPPLPFGTVLFMLLYFFWSLRDMTVLLRHPLPPSQNALRPGPKFLPHRSHPLVGAE